MPIIVYVDYVPDTRDIKVSEVAYLSELAHKLAERLGTEVWGLIVNSMTVTLRVQEYKIFKRLISVRIRGLAEGTYVPTTFAEAIVEICRKYNPEVLLFPATYRCREIAPFVAAKLETGIVADVSEIYVDDKGEVVSVKPSFGENVLAHITIPNKTPKIFTVRAPSQMQLSKRYDACEVVNEEFVHRTANIKYVKTVKIEDPDSDILPERANVVIGVGAGVRPDVVELVKTIAKRLRIGIGATKRITDRGVLPYKFLLGDSGKIIRARLYIAFGISGAPQHMSGVKACDTVVAVNIDEKAPIRAYADYFIKLDANDVLRKLAELVLTS